MPTLIQDTFVEASNVAITDHTPTPGGTGSWAEEGTTIDINATIDEVTATGTSDWYARISTDVGADAMVVSARLKVSAVANRKAGIAGRMSGSDFDNAIETHLEWFSGSNANIHLIKEVAGTRTSLAAAVDSGVATATFCTVVLHIHNGDDKIRVTVNGVEKFNVTDDSLAGNTRAGIFINGNGLAGTKIDDFLLESVPASATVFAPAAAQLSASGGMIGRVYG